MNSGDWCQLPEHILLDILSYLSLSDRSKAANVCKSWNESFQCQLLWKHFDFLFHSEKESRYIKCLEKHGQYLKSVYIELEQHLKCNRENACYVIEGLAKLKERRLKFFRIKFTGENPYFYAGQEFIDALCVLFGPCELNSEEINPLQHIDLSGLTVAYDDRLFTTLAENHREIKTLNIQNNVLVCKVTPMCILGLIIKCRKLEDLSLYNCSVSEDVLLALTESDRTPLSHLSIICRREEKYGKDIGSEMWATLVKKLPNLRVTLAFDHTCPLNKVSQVMKPEIPVSILRLETFTYIYDELSLATSYYRNTLEKLVVNTPTSRNSPEFNRALLEMATKCDKLRSVHIFCVIEKETVEKVLTLHPKIKESGSYTLNYLALPHPWVPGKDC